MKKKAHVKKKSTATKKSKEATGLNSTQRMLVVIQKQMDYVKNSNANVKKIVLEYAKQQSASWDRNAIEFANIFNEIVRGVDGLGIIVKSMRDLFAIRTNRLHNVLEKLDTTIRNEVAEGRKASSCIESYAIQLRNQSTEIDQLKKELAQAKDPYVIHDGRGIIFKNEFNVP